MHINLLRGDRLKNILTNDYAMLFKKYRIVGVEREVEKISNNDGLTARQI